MSKNNTNKIQFEIQRVYIKDISFESPNTPEIFHIFQKECKPDINLNMDTSALQLSNETYETILHVTIKSTIDTKTIFLCDIQQAGVFIINGMNNIQITQYLGIHCPSILFPYARECIDNLVSRGTFPQLNIAPIDFNELFIKHTKYQATQEN